MSDPFVNEGASRQLIASFFDAEGAPAVPVTVTYRIDCLTTETEVLGDSVVMAAAQVTLTITGQQNRMIDPVKSREKRRVTLIAGYADGNEPQYFDYWIKNLSGV